MVRLSIICDGDRDRLAAPKLVEKLIGHTFEPTVSEWPRLSNPETRIKGGRGHGYEAKLRFALKQARDERADGVVAILDADTDKQRERLKQARAARDADRARYASLPTAIGEARPHFEVWLLDDPVAVRVALGLERSAAIPDALNCHYPKEALDDLCSQTRAGEESRQILCDIAVQHELGRCNHREATGLQAFCDDLRAEIGPLFAA